MSSSFSRTLLVTSLFGLFGLCSCAAADDASFGAGTAEAEVTTSSSTEESELMGSLESPPLAEQIAIIQERLEATNTRDWDRWQGLHTEDAIRTAPELEEPLRGSSALRAAIEVLSLAFPDYHLELTQAFGQGEWLAVRLHTSGTMTGPLMLSDGTEVPATGRSIEQDWAALVRFEGTRIAEFHEFYDQLSLMSQLGLLAP